MAMIAMMVVVMMMMMMMMIMIYDDDDDDDNDYLSMTEYFLFQAFIETENFVQIIFANSL